jgi:hypothetical protein
VVLRLDYDLRIGEDAANSALFQEFVGVGQELFKRQIARVYVGQDCALGGVLLVDDADFGLPRAGMGSSSVSSP